jgi:precorrin-3B synthase
MSAVVKGWCPGAWRPMASGDGLIVRVRPRLGRMSAAQALGLAELALRFGSGVIDLTSRANLQVRGVTEAGHDGLLQEISALGLLDPDPEAEARRNLIATPLWTDGDVTDRLGQSLEAALPGFPKVPAKMGYAVDTGPMPLLQGASADLRLERSADGLILRADGAALGRPVTESGAMEAVADVLAWFVETGGCEAGRMSRHLAHVDLPEDWRCVAPLMTGPAIEPGARDGARVYGAPFGQIAAADLAALITTSGASDLQTTPWRLFALIGGRETPSDGFVTTPGDPLLAAHACPGAPACASATVETRALARRLAGRVAGTFHVSGCTKGCAHPGPAALTLVGREGAFDLVRNGCASDVPYALAVDPETLTREPA